MKQAQRGLCVNNNINNDVTFDSKRESSTYRRSCAYKAIMAELGVTIDAQAPSTLQGILDATKSIKLTYRQQARVREMFKRFMD